MKPYIVTVYQAGKRTRYPAIAASWYDCWLTAVNEFGRRLIEHAMATFGMIGANERDADALAVLRWIRAGPVERRIFDRTTLYNAHEARFGGNTDRATEAMKRLASWGVLRHVRQKPGAKGGRPRDAYLVNPAVFPEK